MQKANRAHVLYATTFIRTFLQILSYLRVASVNLRVASVISSMEFSETFSEIKLLVAMVMMMSFIAFA